MFFKVYALVEEQLKKRRFVLKQDHIGFCLLRQMQTSGTQEFTAHLLWKQRNLKMMIELHTQNPRDSNPFKYLKKHKTPEGQQFFQILSWHESVQFTWQAQNKAVKSKLIGFYEMLHLRSIHRHSSINQFFWQLQARLFKKYKEMKKI